MSSRRNIIYAFIDSQNINLGTSVNGWKLDWGRFRLFLRNKYDVKKAFLFIGYIKRNSSLYDYLERVGKKYGKTQNQIVLNWIGSLGFKPEVFSTSKEHIQENWEAMQFKMEKKDCDEITEFRIPGYTPPEINWGNIGLVDSIVPPVMGFEENYNLNRKIS